MESNITMYQPHYQDYIQKKIDSKFIDYNKITIYIDIEEKKLLKIFKKYFGEPIFKYEDRTIYFDDEQKKLSNGIGFAYDYNDFFILFSSNPIEHNEKDITFCSQIMIYVQTYPKKDITFLEEFNKNIKKLTNELQKNELIVEEKNIFYTVTQNENDFVIKKQKIKDFVLDIELNYGKDFLHFHNNLYEHLKNKNHGLTLLYGEPGTGKTFYSKYLISLLCNDKDIIYVPSFLIEQLSNPDFISFIENNKNSILIIEDAEFVLSKREDNYNSQAVSNLLNITSGLLNDISGIQVIATFNMKKENIDDALLRPGRLVAEHKFELLKPEEATLLSKHLEKNITYTKNVSIAEVYEGKENLHKKTKKRISLLNDTETTSNNE